MTRLTADAPGFALATWLALAAATPAQPLRSRQLLLLKPTTATEITVGARARDCSAALDVSWVAAAWRPAHAWVGAWVASALYVGSLYLWPARYRAPRDHPAVIRRRTVSLLGTCVASCALPWVALRWRRRARRRAPRASRSPRPSPRRRASPPPAPAAIASLSVRAALLAARARR